MASEWLENNSTNCQPVAIEKESHFLHLWLRIIFHGHMMIMMSAQAALMMHCCCRLGQIAGWVRSLAGRDRWLGEITDNRESLRRTPQSSALHYRHRVYMSHTIKHTNHILDCRQVAKPSDHKAK